MCRHPQIPGSGVAPSAHGYSALRRKTPQTLNPKPQTLNPKPLYTSHIRGLRVAVTVGLSLQCPEPPYTDEVDNARLGLRVPHLDFYWSSWAISSFSPGNGAIPQYVERKHQEIKQGFATSSVGCCVESPTRLFAEIPGPQNKLYAHGGLILLSHKPLSRGRLSMFFHHGA